MNNRLQNKPNSCCSESMSCDPLQMMPLAMAYVPWQQWQNVYEGSKGLENGTIFEELIFPFQYASRVCGDGGNCRSNERMERRNNQHCCNERMERCKSERRCNEKNDNRKIENCEKERTARCGNEQHRCERERIDRCENEHRHCGQNNRCDRMNHCERRRD